jgi:hypothetical protein
MLQLPKDNQKAIDVLNALLQLSINPELKSIREWLESEKIRISESKDVELNDVKVRWAQGVCQTLKQQIKFIDDSRDLLIEVERR